MSAIAKVGLHLSGADAVCVTWKEDRSALGCMGLMRRAQEPREPASHSIIALLAETSS
jgi:hypothetical protein